MMAKCHFFFLLFLFTSLQGKSQRSVSVNIPTVEMETEYVWRTIQDIAFFEENNYQISLPNGTLIEGLKAKAKLGTLTDTDYEELEKFMKKNVYRESDYKKGYEKITNELDLINKMVNEIEQSNFNWIFKTFNTYHVNLTLYGPGGSYNPDEGSILIFTTPQGQFKSYDNPANTVIHEITHIGIEEAIITKYNVPHALKERIVDTFVSLNFKQYLPDYRIQDMGEYRIDPYLTVKSNLENLDQIVHLVMNGGELPTDLFLWEKSTGEKDSNSVICEMIARNKVKSIKKEIEKSMDEINETGSTDRIALLKNWLHAQPCVIAVKSEEVLTSFPGKTGVSIQTTINQKIVFIRLSIQVGRKEAGTEDYYYIGLEGISEIE